MLKALVFQLLESTYLSSHWFQIYFSPPHPYPKDAFDNLQDYKNQTDDGLSVTVTVNDLYTKKVALEKKEDNRADPHTFFYIAAFTPEEVGTYVVDMVGRCRLGHKVDPGLKALGFSIS